MAIFEKICSRIREIIDYKIHKISILRFIKYFGLINGTKYYFLKRHPGIYLNKEIIFLTPPQAKYPLKVRNQTNDVPLFEHTFLAKDYEFPVNIKPRLIIDGGANVGYSAIFFSLKFSEAEIIAVEPEEANIKMLKENISSYPHIKYMECGLWNNNKWPRIKDIGLGEWGFMVEENDARDPEVPLMLSHNL